MNNKYFLSIVIIALVLVSLIYIFLNFKTSNNSNDSDTYQQSVQLNKGMDLYQQNCASCHGGNLEGQANWQNRNKAGLLTAPPHDETGHTWHHDDLTLFNITKYGGQWALDRAGIKDWKSGMPAFETTLSDEEIQWTLNYIKSTWSQKIKQIQERSNP